MKQISRLGNHDRYQYHWPATSHACRTAIDGRARHRHIINIGSTAGNWPYPGGNTYGASKAFVQNFSRALRADLLGKHVRVSNIEPGMAQTNFSNVRFKGDAERADKVYAGTKPMTAEDIADIIYWVTSVPSHVNVNTLEVMPVCQAWSALTVNRDMEND